MTNEPANHESYRAPSLSAFFEDFAKRFDISPTFVEASDHPYNCTCEICLQWWREMGPDPDTGLYGPFGAELPTEETQ